MVALKKEQEPAKPTFPAHPAVKDVCAEDLFRRTMDRFPKTMARLGE
ncbi:hypothetical protein [Altericroceibacterium indicum]|nr:hypothetical protein [Altericroceibacterium indicum]